MRSNIKERPYTFCLNGYGFHYLYNYSIRYLWKDNKINVFKFMNLQA